MIYGVRLYKEIPVVGNLYSIIKDLYQPQYLILNNDYYVDYTEEESDRFDRAIKTHYKLLDNGWVCWDAYLINNFLLKVLTSTPFIMYNKIELNNIPRFKELQWVVTYNNIDSNVADLLHIKNKYMM
jgi:hypothetical protein